MASQGGAALARAVAPTPFDPLPLAVALRIFALLPADARLLAAAVCRSWRAMLADRSAWARLDLSRASGVASPSRRLLRAAAARAGGQLEFLSLFPWLDDTYDELVTILASNAGSMRWLVLPGSVEPWRWPQPQTVTALLQAAPALRLLETSMLCTGVETLPVLRKEPPFGPLRLVSADLRDITALWPALVGGLAVHTQLDSLSLWGTWHDTQTEGDAVVDTLLSLTKLEQLCFRDCHAPVSVLVRLLRHTTLKVLCVYDDGARLMEAPGSAALLCDALRANTRVAILALCGVDLWQNMEDATAVLATLQARSTLEVLTLSQNRVAREDAAAAGAAIGALIEHCPTLLELNISNCDLGDAGLGPIMDALPRARCLVMLDCSDNGMNEAFARERLLPAVRACTSLRLLQAGHKNELAELVFEDQGPAVREALLLVQQRD